MRYLNTVYVTEHRAKISRSKGSLLVSTATGKQRIPIEAIDGVVIIGGGQITSEAVAACIERQIRVACLRRGGQVRYIVGGPRSGNVHLRLAQYGVATDEGRSLDLARTIVVGKLQSSRRMVLRWGRDAPADAARRLDRRADEIGDRISRARSARDGNHLRGIEGDAARSYFTAMRVVVNEGPFTFETRNRRPPRDPVNALLGFAYGLFTTELVGALEAAGLDHQIGFFHRARSGRPSLALDQLEELRVWADRFVVRLVRRRELGPASFEAMPGGAVYLSADGRRRFLELWEQEKEREVLHLLLDRPVQRFALPSIQATLLARHLRGDLASYPAFVLAA